MVGASNFSLVSIFHVMPKARREEAWPIVPSSMIRKTWV